MTTSQAHPGPDAATSARLNVTRADVAARAGVSSAVVSYVVNGGPRPVAATTRERVLAAISELGYRPNAAARALRLGSSELLGLILPDTRNPFLMELAHAVEEEANGRGYSLILANSGLSEERELQQVRQLVSRQVDGVIAIPMRGDTPVQELVDAGISRTLLAYSGTGSPAVGTDLVAGAEIAVRHLIEHGYEDIALVIGHSSAGHVDGRERGWRTALEAAALTPGKVLRADFTREGGYQAGLELAAGPLPRAVFVSSDMQGVGLLLALHESGVQVPSQVAVVSFDGSPEAAYTWPALTTVRQPIEDLAKAAVDSALAMIERREPEASQQFAPELVVRQSCGC